MTAVAIAGFAHAEVRDRTARDKRERIGTAITSGQAGSTGQAMNRSPIELHRYRHRRAVSRVARTMFNLTPGWFHAALIVVLSVWVLHSFLEVLLAASVTAIASWPLYTRFATRFAPRAGRAATSFLFTTLMAIFVLAPLMFAFWALLTEVNVLLLEVAAADRRGLAPPEWLESVPLAGPWMAAWWQSELAHAGAFSVWLHRTDAAALLGWVQSLGHFMARHAFIIVFTVLVLFFIYQEGERLAQDFRRLLRRTVGDRAEGYVDVATQALRASVNSMLVVGLFDGFASGVAYALAGVPHPAVWAAITGTFALIPFLGYFAVAALTLQLAMAGAATAATLAFAFGCFVLLFGDKVVRPLVARDGTRLSFVWVLIGCLGGFEVFGLVGLVVGPVVLALARELWEQRVRDLSRSDGVDSPSAIDDNA